MAKNFKTLDNPQDENFKTLYQLDSNANLIILKS